MSDKDILWLGKCPRCGADKVTFDVKSYVTLSYGTYQPTEIFVRCRNCGSASIFLVEKGSATSPDLAKLNGTFANAVWDFLDYVVIIPNTQRCPDHTPPEIASIFNEAAQCLGIGAYEAAGTMFRKVVDKATRDMLPPQPNDEDRNHADFIAWKVRKDLKLRLEWLLEKGKLSRALEPLLENVREDGNDAAHDRIGREEAEDLQDFTVVLLETLYTVPGQVEANRLRRLARREGGGA